LALLIFSASSLQASAVAPLPPGGFKIEPCPAGITSEIANSGRKWSGEIRSVKPRKSSSAETQNIVVVVEKIINPTQAEVYVSWGDVQGPYALAKAGSARVTAEMSVEGGSVKLVFVAKNKWHFTCKVKGSALFCHLKHEERKTERWGDLSPM
jgi:hypothetical protein